MYASALIKRSFDYIVVETPYHRGWVRAIKYMVPPAHRDWNGKVWTFTDIFYPIILEITAHYFGSRITDTAKGPEGKIGWEEKWRHYLAMSGMPNTHTKSKRSPMSGYYDLLGVADNAPPSLVKKAWKQLCKIHHPDAGGDEEMMKDVNEAYFTLKKKGLAE